MRCVTGTAPPGESEDEPEVSDILDTGGEVLVSSNTVDGAVGSWHDGDLLQSFFYYCAEAMSTEWTLVQGNYRDESLDPLEGTAGRPRARLVTVPGGVDVPPQDEGGGSGSVDPPLVRTHDDPSRSHERRPAMCHRK